MSSIVNTGGRISKWRKAATAKFSTLPKWQQTAILWGSAIAVATVASLASPDPAHAQNLESFATNVRGLLSSTLLRTLAVIAVIVTGLLWFTGRASTAILVTVIIGIAIVFSADSIVGVIAG
jgi:type IV secretory pathway VirB2 component (pilin)